MTCDAVHYVGSGALLCMLLSAGGWLHGLHLPSTSFADSMGLRAGRWVRGLHLPATWFVNSSSYSWLQAWLHMSLLAGSRGIYR